ncbi:MAG: hypothetical protein QM308_07045 [Bacillota bacterium]|nr:hypothetical protein [Bacillota bacterium]
MSYGTERFFKELAKATEGENLNDQEAMQERMDKFTKEYFETMDKKDRPLDAFDYLEMAEDAANGKEAIRYAKKALELDSYLLDAELIIAEEKSYSAEEFEKQLKAIIKKGETQLLEQGISKEENEGDFYGLHETRPYMRMRKEYADLLISQGKFRLSISEIEDIIRLNESDNLGMRYMLMALYSFFEDEEKALALYKKYEEDSAFMLLPLIALYYKKEDDKQMRMYIRKLKRSNPDVLKALKLFMDEDGREEIEDIAYSTTYRPASMEEVVLALTQSAFLYVPMNDFMDKLYREF